MTWPRCRTTWAPSAACRVDRAHPLWTVHLLQGFRGGSALVQRYHHSMADGIRLTQVMLGMLDPLDEPGRGRDLPRHGRGPRPRPAPRNSRLRSVRSLLNTAGSVVEDRVVDESEHAAGGSAGCREDRCLG